ncbi:hypothetical protein N7509_006331 [Penicillium cosmopolitanum]|uniref:PH domain-containing protein n=1 Tax=Penicillium cosmopolitanum TaxID=1131564 RepID=A0A9W9W494_9EURO|nr:uncharacterized protein N7509_006331 [Penicillium cosmopolitanum]KAJ5398218.1 hypothetical protein N7509_006331 [Penicillium cosmopolitanum]
MARHRVSAPAQQPVLKGTFYDPVPIEYAVGNQTSRKPEPAVRPDMASDGKTNEQNPSIARSMSRYRRNRRPNTSGDAPTPTPAVPDRARNQPVPPVPDVTSQTLAAEVHAREQHRLDAMAQLTGGDQSSRSAISQYEKQEKQPQSRTKAQPVPTHQQTSRVDTRSHHDARPASGDNRKSLLQKMKLSKSSKTPLPNEPVPRYIGVGGRGIVPGTDAPVSAVNAGERQVLVQYSDVSNHLVVTPSTRVNDLLQTAVRELSRDIDPEKFICIESFHQVGLERSLRRYERVRDIMNSWAHDADNRLVIVPPSSMEALAQLESHQVPTEKPAETTVYLYHSQRPGKWDKRYVTLRPDGQVVIAKKENLKDSTSICHLSDFDIYCPSARAMAKEIKPPKKICFAIKSQQKSSMFLSTDKFVHFFSSNDRDTADKWFRVVQRWRSWYLVNQLGAAEQTESEATLPKRSLTQKGSQRHRKAANDVPVPLLDLTDSEPIRPTGNSIDCPRPSASKDIVSRKKTVREHASPPPSFPQTLSLDTGTAGQADDGPLVQGVRPDEVEAATFSPTGLLGRSYTQRKQAMNEREEREKRANQELFTAQSFLAENHNYSPSDIIHQQSGRTATMTSTAPPGLSRNKSVSQKQQQKPLVDLTPVFQEPPQHTRKGRGVKVGAGTQLIDAATGPELAVGTVNIPSATAWRRPTNELPTQSRYRSNTARSVRHGTEPKPSSSGSGHASPASPSNPFVSNTLLANSASRQASSTHTKPYTGHGVATGDRNAPRPMLDMSPENPFAEGSLLRQL